MNLLMHYGARGLEDLRRQQNKQKEKKQASAGAQGDTTLPPSLKKNLS